MSIYIVIKREECKFCIDKKRYKYFCLECNNTGTVDKEVDLESAVIDIIKKNGPMINMITDRRDTRGLPNKLK
jgi:hypothetical protein